MSKSFSVGIDIGSHHTKVVVANRNSKSRAIEILGTGKSPSKGIRHGYVTNSTEAIKSIKRAVREAEKDANISIKNAFVSIGGVSLEGTRCNGSVAVTRADKEVTDLDVQTAIQNAENTLAPHIKRNQKILHTVPLAHTLDKKKVLGKAVGMIGSHLSVEVLFITCLEQHISDLIEIVEEAGVQVDDIIAAPVAAGVVSLTKTQKIAGCVLTNIGADTVSIIVYENNEPISLEIFPIGSRDITHDIALGLQIPIEEAEKVKAAKSKAQPGEVRRDVDEIITKRLTDVFILIKDHLEKIDRDELLPAGIILSGGGSGVATIEDLARATLRIPSQITNNPFFRRSNPTTVDSYWSVAAGLCVLAIISSEEEKYRPNIIAQNGKRLIAWIKQFLP